MNINTKVMNRMNRVTSSREYHYKGYEPYEQQHTCVYAAQYSSPLYILLSVVQE